MRRHTDWLGLTVRFICGLPLGALVGLAAATLDLTARQILLCSLAGALLFGLLSVLLGDRLWKNLDWLLWW